MFKKLKVLLNNADKIVEMLTALYDFVQYLKKNVGDLHDIVEAEQAKYKQLEEYERFKNANEE